MNPKTIKEAIDSLQTFFECDLWSKFHTTVSFPAIKDRKKVKVCFRRRDCFKNEKELCEYLKDHFDILRKEIKGIDKLDNKNKSFMRR